MSLFSVLVVLTLAHPGPLRTNLLRLQYETFCSQNVEEDLPDEIRGRCASHFQTCAESFVAGTMHHARDTPVEKTVARLEGWDEERTGCVVSATACVSRAKTT